MLSASERQSLAGVPFDAEDMRLFLSQQATSVNNQNTVMRVVNKLVCGNGVATMSRIYEVVSVHRRTLSCGLSPVLLGLL